MKRARREAQLVAWVVKHPTLLHGDQWREIFRGMQRDGLYSHKTYFMDAQRGVERAVEGARAWLKI